jgi:hypothetical protein
MVAEAGARLAGDRLNQIEAQNKRADEEKKTAESVRDLLQRKLLLQTHTKVWIEKSLEELAKTDTSR